MSPSSTRIRLRVAPGAVRTAVVGRHGDGWKVSVAAPAQNGKANDALVTLLADALSLRRTDVEVVAGRSSRDKIVAVTGLDLGEADSALARAAGDGGVA
jgi:uncharacterized protein (TIGR00251 family)